MTMICPGYFLWGLPRSGQYSARNSTWRTAIRPGPSRKRKTCVFFSSLPYPGNYFREWYSSLRYGRIFILRKSSAFSLRKKTDLLGELDVSLTTKIILPDIRVPTRTDSNPFVVLGWEKFDLGSRNPRTNEKFENLR